MDKPPNMNPVIFLLSKGRTPPRLVFVNILSFPKNVWFKHSAYNTTALGLRNNITYKSDKDLRHFIFFLKRNVQKNHHLYFHKILFPHILANYKNLFLAS